MLAVLPRRGETQIILRINLNPLACLCVGPAAAFSNGSAAGNFFGTGSPP
jgi:hypothetical protein